MGQGSEKQFSEKQMRLIQKLYEKVFDFPYIKDVEIQNTKFHFLLSH
jgi:hypothetical protein